MAITKRALKIQAEKNAIRDQIEQEYKAGAEAVKRVPDFVLNGKHQVAVAWKYWAAFFTAAESTRGPKTATADHLKDVLQEIKQAVEALCGKAPLV